MVRGLGSIVGLTSALLACSLSADAATQLPHHQQPTAASHKLNKKPCYAHYRPAHVTHAVQPNTPSPATSENVTGIVEVRVTVRASGAIVGAEAISGPALLRQAAVDAALATTFVPEIRDCRPIPGAYSYFVNFTGA